MSGRESLAIPVNKSYFTTFMNNFLSISYLEDKSTNLESLKLLLFPAEFSDNGIFPIKKITVFFVAKLRKYVMSV
jgi:hypothetical protein